MKQLIEIRCYCDSKKRKGVLLGKVEEGTNYELFCPRCKKLIKKY